MFKCARVCDRSGSRVFLNFLPCLGFCVSRGKKWNRSYLPQTGPPERSAKSRPQLPSLKGFHGSAEDALCAKAPLHTHLSLYSEGRSSLCVYHLFGSCYSLRRLMFADLPATNETIRRPHYSAACLSRLSVLVVVWRIKNCLRLRSALMTPEPCCAFDCATVSIQPRCGGRPQIADVCFSLM